MIFDAIWAMNKIIIIINIRFHRLLKYLSEMVFNGDFIKNVFRFNHMISIIKLVMLVLFKLFHFCFGFDSSEIT